MTESKGNVISNNDQNNKKTSTNNQWVSTGRKYPSDNRERRDGPGGENTDK